MSIFGQVWLWSLLSFVAGVLLTWLVMVRPARKQVDELEDQLLEARARSKPAPVATPPADDFVVDEWESAPPSLADEVLVSSPRVDELSSFEDDRPRSLHERLSPESDSFQRSSPPSDYTDEEPPRLVPSYAPAAEVAPAEREPTAPPEIDEHVDDFIYQPREVWAEQESFLDEAGEQEDDAPSAAEQTSLIQLPAEDQWPENDLTGEYAGMQDQIADRLSGGGKIAARLGGGAEETTYMEPVEDTESERTAIREPIDLNAAATAPALPDESPAEQTLIQRPVEPEERPGGAWRPGAAFTPPVQDEPVEQTQQDEPENRTAYEEYLESAADEPAEEAPLVPDHDLGPARRPGAAFDPPEHRPVKFEEPAAPEPAEPELIGFEEPPAAEQPEPEVREKESFTPFGTAPESSSFDPFAAVTPVEPDAEVFQPPMVHEPPVVHENGTRRAPAPAPKKPEPEPVVERPRSLFEPIVEADDAPPLAEQKRPEPPPSQDQPFVPKYVPGPPLSAQLEETPQEVVPQELPRREAPASLPARETAAGLPIREKRSATPPRPAFESPVSQPKAPQPPVRPTRPRPVGFSPSTGGLGGAPSTTTRYQQPEGFNPRSPFGPGSVLPKSDGLAPAADFEVKATLTGRRYYTPESANFTEMRADVWFRTITDAQKAGFRPAP